MAAPIYRDFNKFSRSNLRTALGPPLGSEIAANVVNLACAEGVAFRRLRRVYIWWNSRFRIESSSRSLVATRATARVSAREWSMVGEYQLSANPCRLLSILYSMVPQTVRVTVCYSCSFSCVLSAAC
eukprot:COSAG02_NODE_979_length_15497_cov_5.029549_5_plen_127_part_00